MKTESAPAWFRHLSENRYFFLLLLVGVVMLLLPGSAGDRDGTAPSTDAEQRLQRALDGLEGVGEVYVLLAETEGRSGGITGAVILCQGAEDARVRLQIVGAVSAFTGLGSDRITVLKMKN